MKIIGKTDYGYILEASNNEVAKLMGPTGSTHHTVGTQIKVDDMYAHLTQLQRNRNQVGSAIATLEATATLLKTLPERYVEPKQEEKASS